MNPFLIALLLGLIIGVVLSFKLFLKPIERKRIISYEFPEGWSKNLYQNLPLSFEVGPQTKKKFFNEIQWVLSEKEFFPLGQKDLEGLDCVLICAPFILLEVNSYTQTLKGLKRFLVIDQEEECEQIPKEESHDFTLCYASNSGKVQAPQSTQINKNTQKTLIQLFGKSTAQTFLHETIFQRYALKYNRNKLLQSADAIFPVFKTEFYISNETDQEELIWIIHEIFCYSPVLINKTLPKTYQCLMKYYDLKK
jgi:Mlc titration factor MtfA (ptsG expression regulator)